MPVTIQRVIFPRRGEVAIESVELPDPGPQGVLVRTLCTAVSAGTEMTAFLGRFEEGSFPIRPGYSHVGVVEAIGEGVDGYQVGERVLSMGGHQSHVLVDLTPDARGTTACLEHIPDGVAPEHAAFTSLGSVALHGIRRAELQVGMGVAVFGQGMVGQLLVQLARWSGGTPIIAVDLVPARLEQARQSGADVVIDASRPDLVPAIRAATSGRGVEAVFDATRTPKTLPAMMEGAARGGKVLIVGSSPGTVEIETFPDLQRKELSIIGCWQPMAPLVSHHQFPWTHGRDRQVVVQLMAEGRLRLDHLITHRVLYTQAPEVFAMMAHGGTGWLGVILTWDTALSV